VTKRRFDKRGTKRGGKGHKGEDASETGRKRQIFPLGGVKDLKNKWGSLIRKTPKREKRENHVGGGSEKNILGYRGGTFGIGRLVQGISHRSRNSGKPLGKRRVPEVEKIVLQRGLSSSRKGGTFVDPRYCAGFWQKKVKEA